MLDSIESYGARGNVLSRRPLHFGPEDSGTKESPVIYAAYPGEKVTLSAGRKLSCNWVPYKDGIMMTQLPSKADFTQLFVNGKRQIRARYPNYDASEPGKSGYLLAAGAISSDVSSSESGSQRGYDICRRSAHGAFGSTPRRSQKNVGPIRRMLRSTSFKPPTGEICSGRSSRLT